MTHAASARRNGSRIIAALAAALLASATARADIGPKPTTTGLTIGPGKDLEGIEVSMAEEEVTLRLVKVMEEVDRLEVTAIFTMRNPGPAATFETGFPAGIYEDSFESFSVKTGGKKVDFDKVNRGGPPAEKRPSRNSKAGPRQDPDYWYVWKASYPSGDSRHEVRYAVRIYRHNLSGFTGYVLHTGAAWKGPIGKAIVTLTFGTGYSSDHILSVEPVKGARREKDRFVWEFADLEPTKESDIQVVYSAQSNADALRKVKEEAKTTWIGKENLVRLIARRPKDWLRTSMTSEELDEYLAALDGLVSEGKEKDGRLVFPETDAGGGQREYARSPDSLLRWIEMAAQAAADHPDSQRAQKVLSRFVALGEKFRAGSVLAGSKVLRSPPDGPYHDKFETRFAGWMEKARKALR